MDYRARASTVGGAVPDVFLSSATRGMVEFRERVRELDPARVWRVSSHLDPNRISPFVVVDALVEQVRKSNIFICILCDHYGTSVFGDAESVSYLETEIYQAALSHNDVYFFKLAPFDPDERLSGLLDLVNSIRPGVIPERAMSEAEVLGEIARILDRSQKKLHRQWPLSIRQLVGQLSVQRTQDQPDIQFLDGVFRPVTARPDKEHLAELLTGIDQVRDVEQRLTRMWIALRELSSAPYGEAKYAEFRPYWNEALGAWTSAAAWYGLHGHLYAGRLAGVNSLLRIREAMNWNDAAHPEFRHFQGGRGGRASEYYSMAKLMPTLRARAEYFQKALDEVDAALGPNTGDPASHMTLRAHILWMMNRKPEAFTAFTQVRTIREETGDIGQIGEALADLGLIHLASAQPRQARRLLEEGAELLVKANRREFAIRARRRLAYARLACLDPRGALNELCQAYEEARDISAYGQITRTMEVAHALAARLGIWRKSSPA